MPRRKGGEEGTPELPNRQTKCSILEADMLEKLEIPPQSKGRHWQQTGEFPLGGTASRQSMANPSNEVISRTANNDRSSTRSSSILIQPNEQNKNQEHNKDSQQDANYNLTQGNEARWHPQRLYQQDILQTVLRKCGGAPVRQASQTLRIEPAIYRADKDESLDGIEEAEAIVAPEGKREFLGLLDQKHNGIRFPRHDDSPLTTDAPAADSKRPAHHNEMQSQGQQTQREQSRGARVNGAHRLGEKNVIPTRKSRVEVQSANVVTGFSQGGVWSSSSGTGTDDKTLTNRAPGNEVHTEKPKFASGNVDQSEISGSEPKRSGFHFLSWFK
eukprot:GHVT01016461.1.p1 GENE.GHVT01016461.1~~GHVT01016461.1.p1  ORF type:complete len:329 (-),score=31.42 GHVT01016461.1:747-1733(-)